MLGIGSGLQPRGGKPVDRRRRIANAPLGSLAGINGYDLEMTWGAAQ